MSLDNKLYYLKTGLMLLG